MTPTELSDYLKKLPAVARELESQLAVVATATSAAEKRLAKQEVELATKAAAVESKLERANGIAAQAKAHAEKQAAHEMASCAEHCATMTREAQGRVRTLDAQLVTKRNELASVATQLEAAKEKLTSLHAAMQATKRELSTVALNA